MPCKFLRGGVVTISFNPRPAVRPGDARGQLDAVVFVRCFNPRPAVRPGDAAGRR